MKKVKGLTNRIVAMLMSGMLVVGAVPGTVLASESQADIGQTSEIAAEVTEVPSGADSEEVSAEAYSEETLAQEEEAAEAQHYTVTLDANGGYFVNEWDDALGESVEQAEVVEKHLPVGGNIATVPVFTETDQDGQIIQTMVFAGWSLEKDGELVSQAEEEYVPEDNCSLYAVWEASETAVDEGSGQQEPEEAGVADTDQVAGTGYGDGQTVGETETESLNIGEEDSSQEYEDMVAAEAADTVQETAEDEYTAPEIDNEQDTAPAQEVFVSEEKETSEEVFDASIVESSEGEENLREDAAKGGGESGTCGDNLTWKLDEEGILIISGTGEMEDYPNDIKPWNEADVKKVIIDQGVTHIGSCAFGWCSYLTDIKIPDSVTSIGSAAFQFCESLTSITLPKGVTLIPDDAFYYCIRLKKITIPYGVTNIGKKAFVDCKSLSKITIPSSVTSISSSAFEGSGINSLTIPNSVTSIGDAAFYNCSALTSIKLPNKITAIDWSAFTYCKNLKEITIPNSVTRIDVGAFAYCESLECIIIPEKVLHIETDAFQACMKLKDVVILSTAVDIRPAFSYKNERTGKEEAIPGLVISGYSGTNVESYAKENKIPFKSLSKSINGATVTIPAQSYTGKAVKPNVTVKMGSTTLKANTDYTVVYRSNTNAGTATATITGKIKYKGTKKSTFTINKAAQSITAKAVTSPIAVGKATIVSVTGAKGTKSFKSSDTTIATVDSKTGKVTARKVGTVKITATSAATANYNATSKTFTVKVVPAATTSLTAANQVTGIKLTWKKVAGANGYLIYCGSTLIKTITSGNTVSFVDKKANTNGTKYVYKVVAKAATGTSRLSKSVAFFRVARPVISSLRNVSSKKMKVKWGKNAKATGYKILYSRSKTFISGNKSVTFAGASNVSKVIGNLTKGKTYYVSVRAYKIVGGKVYWSEWSAVKGVKISK